MEKILVIDDDQDICFLLNRFLTKNGFQVETASSGTAGISKYKEFCPQLVLCDFRLEDCSGIDIIKELKAFKSCIPIIMMSGFADIKNVVKSIKIGAFDYISKPLITDEILKIVKKALKTVEVESDITPIQKKSEPIAKQINSTYIFSGSPAIKSILNQIELVSKTNYSVIIYGESGSGKEAIANEIHLKSTRAEEPFVAIDCGALSKELIASELFGYEKGAFTGAVHQKKGAFELANGGTIFLDEIANLNYESQATLLRVIQERKIRRLGGVKDIVIDVRIIVASNELLSTASKAGKFREDLFHRFNEFSFIIPPLRERVDDIRFYANYFLDKTNEELGKNIHGFSKEVLSIFDSYFWPGNLRELNNVVKRATLLCEDKMITVTHLPFELTQSHSSIRSSNHHSDSNFLTTTPSNDNLTMKSASIDAEFEVILKALKECNYNKSKAALLLNIDRKTLYNKMRVYDYYHK